MREVDWARVEDIFHQARELPLAMRAGFVARQPPELRATVEDLLRCDSGCSTSGEAAEDTIFRAVGSAATLFSRPSHQVGQWRLVRPIGEGGMGSVYLGVRTDGAFDKKVAVKFVRRGMDSPSLRLRLEAERRILARLEHPNIARLLDAGATSEGQPYLVMEYVEGRSIVEYASAHDLSVRQKIELFLQVCSAVEYAHRNLVVHRDLKPGNILVGADGAPRLLDFGIAKLLDAGTAQSGITQLRLMSFEWASPEQIRGESVTTATDVYSLGAVLFQLLSGELPFALQGLSALDAERLISRTEAPRVSTRVPALIGQLRGDIDNIVQKALRGDPAVRYSSVTHLIADLRRYLAGQPIEARDYSSVERMALLIRRHRVPAVASAVALLSLVVGASLVVRFAIQANAERAIAVAERARAESERERAQRGSDEAARQQKFAESKETDAQLQRAAAEAQRIIAERSLRNEQQVLDGVVSGVYGDMMSLPGSTGARRTALETVIPALEKLAAAQSANAVVSNLLARAYQRMGEFLAATNSSGMGNPKQGLQYYEKALRIAQRLTRENPRNSDYLIGRSVIQSQIASLLTSAAPVDSNSWRDILARFTDAVESAREGARLTPWEPEFLNRVTDALMAKTALTLQHPETGFLTDIAELHQMIDRDLKAHPDNADSLDRAGRLSAVEASYHSSQGEWAVATRMNEQALDFRERASALHPNDTVIMRSIMITSSNVAAGYRRLEGPNSPKVEAAYQRMTSIAEKLAAFDPEDRTARYDLAMSLQRLGAFHLDSGRSAAAIAPSERSVVVLRELEKQNALSVARLRNLALSLLSLGNVYEAQKRREEAEKAWREALGEAESLLVADAKDGSALTVASKSALFVGRATEGPLAIELANKAVGYAERLAVISSAPPQQIWLARARGVAALVLAKAGRREDAVRLAGRSAEAQSHIPEQAFTDWPAAERAQVKALIDSANVR